MNSAKPLDRGQTRLSPIHVAVVMIVVSAVAFARARPDDGAKLNEILALRQEIREQEPVIATEAILVVGLVLVGAFALALWKWGRFVTQSLPPGRRSVSRAEGPAYFWAFVSFLATALAVTELLKRTGSGTVPAAAVGYGCGAVLAISIARWRTHAQPWSTFLQSIGIYIGPRPKSEIALALVGFVVICLLLTSLALVAVAMSAAPIERGSITTKLVAMGLVFPAIEEVMFRGLLQRAVGTRFGLSETTLIVAAVFCFAHPWSLVGSSVIQQRNVLSVISV